eukprot:3656900-Rhodomonas_salina.1
MSTKSSMSRSRSYSNPACPHPHHHTRPTRDRTSSELGPRAIRAFRFGGRIAMQPYNHARRHNPTAARFQPRAVLLRPRNRQRQLAIRNAKAHGPADSIWPCRRCNS